MDGLSSCFGATNALRNIILQWNSEVSEPFTLSDARVWLRRYFIANYGDTSKVDDFLSFLQSNGIMKSVTNEKRHTSLYFPDIDSLNSMLKGNAGDMYVSQESMAQTPEHLAKRMYYRSLSLKLLKKIADCLPDSLRIDLHPSLHYKNSSVVKEILSFPPLESCDYCSNWLVEVGANLYRNKQELDVNINPVLFSYLIFLYKCSNSEVIPRRNMTDVLNDLIQHVIKHLLTFNDFNAPKSATIYLIKFLLERREGQNSRLRHPPSTWITRRISALSSTHDSSTQWPAFHRSRSVSPKSWKRSSTFSDLRTSTSVWTSLTSGRLQKSHSAIFSSNDCLERALCLATTLLPPTTCFMIYYLIMAVRAVQAKAESGENFEEEYFPLSDVKYMASLMTPILFPKASSSKQSRNSCPRDGELDEDFLTVLFSADAGKCTHPSELLKDIVDPAEFPSVSTPLSQRDGASTSKAVVPLGSAFSRLNIGSPRPNSMGFYRARRISGISITSGSSSMDSIMLPPSSVDRSRDSSLLQKMADVELMKLLNGILDDKTMDPQLKLMHLKKFEAFHSEIFRMRFGTQENRDKYFERLERRVALAKKHRTPMAKFAKSSSALFRRKARSTSSKPPK